MKLRKMLGDPLGAEAKELMSIIETQSKTTLAQWSISYVEENYLPILGDDASSELLDGINAVKKHINKEITLKDLKVYAKEARLSTDKVEDPKKLAAAKAITTACAVTQTPTNSLGFIFYGCAAYAYSKVGYEESKEVYDELAIEEMKRALKSLKSVAVENEEKPVKVKWNC